jgi:2-methylcitrate dehydratase PrpD
MARFITEAKFEDIPTPAVNLAKLCLLDAVGCAVYGTTRPLGKTFTSLVDELGGKQALLSYIVGFDVTLNTTHAMGEDHYGRGWHNTSSIGTLGSTAAAAKMLNLDEMQTRMAPGIGASQAWGLRANFGTMTKPFHPGNACRAGVMAAKMAQKGYEANPDVPGKRCSTSSRCSRARC